MKRALTASALALCATVSFSSHAAAATDLQNGAEYLEEITPESARFVGPATDVSDSLPELTAKDAQCDNCVALTFDDGPGDDTERLLNMLQEADAHATFFVVGGNADMHPDILRRIVRDGHTLANHTYNHPALSTLPEEKVSRELAVTTQSIERGVYWGPRWLRPPYGDTNDRVAAVAGEAGLALALWDVDTNDWKHHDPSTTCDITVNQAQAGSIVLMHDIHSTTVDAVPCIIDGLQARGMEMVSIDELIPSPQAGHTYTQWYESTTEPSAAK